MSNFQLKTSSKKLFFFLVLSIGSLPFSFDIIKAISLSNFSIGEASKTFYDAKGNYSIEFPRTWSITTNKYWENDSQRKFDSLFILQAPDGEIISIRIWKDIPQLPLADIYSIYLQPILSLKAQEKAYGQVNGNEMVFIVNPGEESSSTPTSIYSLFQCGNMVYRIQYIGSQGGSQIQTFKEILNSLQCSQETETQQNIETVIPDVSSNLFFKIGETPNVDYCEGFWDPNGNRYNCGECTWWASYSRPDIPNTYAEWPGNAGAWDNLAEENPNFEVVENPEPGAIAVWEPFLDGAGSAGHVAYVTWVNENGSFNVSEMNWDRPTYPAPPYTRPNNEHPNPVNDTANIRFIRGGVTFFENANFGGNWFRTYENDSDLSDNYTWGASSIFIPAGWDTIFYRYPNFSPSSYRHRWGATGLNALEASFWDLSIDNFSDSSNMNDNVRSIRTSYFSCLAEPIDKNTSLLTDPVCGEPPPPPPDPEPTPTPVPGDNTPPSASGFTATTNGGTADLSTSGVQDNSGGSGVREVRFSAKFNNQWVGIGTDTTSPYSLAWNMCASGVPDGDVELGMEVWDNANNVWIWSQHYSNPHITKSYNCEPPPPSEGVTLFENTGLGGGSCYITQDVPSIGNYCGSGWNDNAESVLVQGPYYFALYLDDWYGGGTPYTGNPTGDLPPEWRNKASSIRIRRNSPAAFTLFDLGDFNGEAWASDRTIYDLSHWNWNDKAESIQVASGYGLIVCEHADFKGICGRATGPAEWSDINALAQGLRNNVSSIRVCSGPCPEAGEPPTLIYPINNQAIEAGEPVNLSWSGAVEQFYVEVWGGALGSTLQSGWTNSVQWDLGVLPESPNQYYWHVKGWKGYGETDWASGSFYVMLPDTTSPSGVITGPQSGGYQGGPTVIISADANDIGSGVNRLEFYAWLDDHWEFLGTDNNAPYSFSWDISSVREGGVWVSADVIDNAGNHSGLIWEPDWAFFIIDKSPPSSAVIPLPAFQMYPKFTVRWSGNDNFTQNDLIFYDVQYQLNCTGPWLDWFVMDNWEGATFNGEVGQTYCFRSRAYDLVGNTEAWPEVADAQTTVNSITEVYLPLVWMMRSSPAPTATPTPTSIPTITPTPTPTITPTPLPSNDWTFMGTGEPQARSGHGMALDVSNNKLVIFGGTCNGFACADTWTYGESGWTAIGGNGPSAREDSFMVYDEDRQKIVLFGGHAWAANVLGDTWEFNGVSWASMNLTTNPPARANQAMTYDPIRKRVVLFGGWQGGSDYLSDTWEYDGINWYQISPVHSPTPRRGARMVYVPALNQIVMFGGLSPALDVIDETWVYDGQDWSQLNPGLSPSARYNHQMVFDPVSNRILLFGGYRLDTGALSDTWAFSNSGWELVLPTHSPPPTWLAGFAYYPPIGGILMFGGNSPNQGNLNSDIWLYTFSP